MERFERVMIVIVSSFLWIASSVLNRFLKLVGRKTRTTCVVLYYHGITREERARFGRQMEALRRLGRAIPAGRKGLLTEGPHHVAVTFDDGFRNTLENALPEMAERNIPATIFIPTGYMGQRPGWIEDGSHKDRYETVVTEEEIRRLPRDLVSIGSHTVSHRDLRRLETENLRREVIESKKKLEGVTGEEITMISLPYGEYDERVLKIIRETGYRQVFSSLPRLTGERAEVTERVPVKPSDWPLEFQLKILGGYWWLPFVLGWKRKICWDRKGRNDDKTF